MLVRSMRAGSSSVITPHQFKQRIGEYASQFRGTEQHDSQEFLAYLLDAIHEDLNLARRAKPMKITEPKDDESMPDQVISLFHIFLFYLLCIFDFL
jgi:ubiquitin C-terminal hydrolase